jgi:hypothetical protein
MKPRGIDTLTDVTNKQPEFQSFFMGGFECATHRRRDRARIDVIASTLHDVYCVEDYALLAAASVRTIRDGLRWHLIEGTPGLYDWSSLLPMLQAAHATGRHLLRGVSVAIRRLRRCRRAHHP